MKLSKKAIIAASAAGMVLAATPSLAKDGAEGNKELVKKAMHELFDLRDLSAIERYWGVPYIQHNPLIPNGRDSLAGLVKSLPADFKYEPGMTVAEGNLVMMHGRYTGFSAEPLTTVDIFRLDHGKIVEHWDVMQADVPADKSKNGNPMFKPGE